MGDQKDSLVKIRRKKRDEWASRINNYIGIIIGIITLLGLSITGIVYIHTNLLPNRINATVVPTTNIQLTSTIAIQSPQPDRTIPSLLQKKFQNQHNNAPTITLPSNVTGGDVIIVAATQYKGQITSITDNHNNFYYSVTTPQHATENSDYAELYYAKNVVGGPTSITITFSFTGNQITSDNIGVYEFSGLDKIAPLDRGVSNSGYGNAPDGGTFFSATGTMLYFAAGLDDNGSNSAPLAGNGYELQDHQDDSTSHERFYTEDRISTQGNSQTNFLIDTNSDWVVIGASFKAAE
ncbi:MAG: hypothetical protein H0U76_02860 [Ktedonobacteraceae bacterium]|nr:hypothetical protein [Ktedonobacteraceae bacterium]MBA3824317.1 hypothetical protein [Ktedonobacterales bacterium]